MLEKVFAFPQRCEKSQYNAGLRQAGFIYSAYSGSSGGGGACVDGLQPADKMQTATAIQQAGLNELLEDLVIFSERQPDSILSERKELEARRAVFAVTAIG